MKNNVKNIAIVLACIGFLTTFTACKKDKTLSDTDQELFEMSKSTTGFTWFNNSSAVLNKSGGSGHPQPFLRTRYNSIAATKLDSLGRIIPGSTFPEGALIVKELLENASTLGRYAILYKKSTSEDADANGWVWGYINADGTVAVKASEKGNSCISCHTQSENIDYMLMNKYFP